MQNNCFAYSFLHLRVHSLNGDVLRACWYQVGEMLRCDKAEFMPLRVYDSHLIMMDVKWGKSSGEVLLAVRGKPAYSWLESPWGGDPRLRRGGFGENSPWLRPWNSFCLLYHFPCPASLNFSHSQIMLLLTLFYTCRFVRELRYYLTMFDLQTSQFHIIQPVSGTLSGWKTPVS